MDKAREKCIREAIALCSEQGLDFTMSQLAARLGMSKKTLYVLFDSKEALLLELVRRMFGGQFDLAGQHSGAADPVFLYAVETALSLSIATAQRKARSLT